jgi:hypothetical protein
MPDIYHNKVGRKMPVRFSPGYEKADGTMTKGYVSMAHDVVPHRAKYLRTTKICPMCRRDPQFKPNCGTCGGTGSVPWSQEKQ